MKKATIGEEGHCFAGNFHGDGYHIDGLDHSLFGHLCGNVYNLGVTGSFTSAGIADTGGGYVENCWISTTGTPDGSVHAVFGNPTESGYKRVNCYYPNTLEYNTVNDNHGMARPMPADAFYNGTVAYDLNGFYLFKRYNDHITHSGSPTEYQYYAINKEDGTLTEPQTKYYSKNAEYSSSGYTSVYDKGGYVEDRYGDGDFRYADGVIPEKEDQRTLVDADGNSHFYPIWPDDYIYFGQMLTYNWNNQRPHEDVPSHIVKNSNRLPNTDESNRIYRAPAYYQSKIMDVAHFNPSVNLVAYSKPKNANDNDLYPAYPNMTAIDFAGHNDTEYNLGLNGQWFYQPLLDEGGLISITNRDETPNLLVYTPSGENAQTYGVLTTYFTEPAYSDYYLNDTYRRVDEAPTGSVFGHLVQYDLTANSDHLLVDKKDFNCPISYTFDDGKRMWYQRMPDLYVDKSKGWEIVSLPFTAELVTTQDKGEITHFYSGSLDVDENGTKIGHEYWLREYLGEKDGTTVTNDIFTAAFNYPKAAGDTKNVGNTFLWDYYYSKNGVPNNTGPDKNADIYQTYYNSGRSYEQYPLLAAAKPYIIGFPGQTYYEFDLSGEWTAKNTATPAPDKLDKQTISFVSEPGITIRVSDGELSAVTEDGYGFMPNYMSKKVEGFLMNAEGGSFDVTPEGGLASVPFRPYFVKQTNGTRAGSRADTGKLVKHIIFDGDDASFTVSDEDPSEEEIGTENMIFTTRRHEILVTSNLRLEADVQIYNISGIMVASFTILPGETISTYVPVSGVYIVRAADGRYQKKLAVK